MGDFIRFVTIDSTRENLNDYKLNISYNEILFIRKVFVTFCILNIWFIFFSLKQLNLHPISFFLGSLIIPLSFEFWARSRFIAADGLVVTFCSAVILSAILFLKKKNFNYLYLCTLFCALAASSKYTAGILFLIPILLLTLFEHQKKKFDAFTPPKWILYFNLNTLKKIFSLVILFFTFFILLNPGLIVEPIKTNYLYFFCIPN